MTNELTHFKFLNFLTQLSSCQVNIPAFLTGPLVAQSCSCPSVTSNLSWVEQLNNDAYRNEDLRGSCRRFV